MNISNISKQAVVIATAIAMIYLVGSAMNNLSKDEATISEFDRTLNAIEYVESKCNPLAIGDNGNAIGSFQIWQIYVNDCNRILGRQEFSLEDRNSRKRSREMVRVYMSRYCPSGDPEKMAKIHNGGPQGHKKKATEKYWLKVKARMDKLGGAK